MQIIKASTDEITNLPTLAIVAKHGIEADDMSTMSVGESRSFQTERGAIQSARANLKHFAPHEALPVAVVSGQCGSGKWVVTYVMAAA